MARLAPDACRYVCGLRSGGCNAHKRLRYDPPPPPQTRCRPSRGCGTAAGASPHRHPTWTGATCTTPVAMATAANTLAAVNSAKLSLGMSTHMLMPLTSCCAGSQQNGGGGTRCCSGWQHCSFPVLPLTAVASI